jgi:hypothetical protein
MGGKSFYFSLKYENDKFDIADDFDEEPDLSEKILLLDPIRPADSGYIGFDKDGNPYASGSRVDQKTKAEISINLYNLANSTNFIDKRQKLWMLLEQTISDTAKIVNSNKSDEEKQMVEDICFSRIRELIDKKANFSSVAIACLKTLQIEPKFQFLNSFKA